MILGFLVQSSVQSAVDTSQPGVCSDSGVVDRPRLVAPVFVFVFVFFNFFFFFFNFNCSDLVQWEDPEGLGGVAPGLKDDLIG